MKAHLSPEQQEAMKQKAVRDDIKKTHVSQADINQLEEVLKFLTIKEIKSAETDALYTLELPEENQNQTENKEIDILKHGKSDVISELPAVNLILQDIPTIESEIKSLKAQIKEEKKSQQIANVKADEQLEQLQNQETKSSVELVRKTLMTAYHKTMTTAGSLGNVVSLKQLKLRLQQQTNKLRDYNRVIFHFKRLEIFSDQVNQLESAAKEQLLLLKSNEVASHELAYIKLAKIYYFLKTFRPSSIPQFKEMDTKISLAMWEYNNKFSSQNEKKGNRSVKDILLMARKIIFANNIKENAYEEGVLQELDTFYFSEQSIKRKLEIENASKQIQKNEMDGKIENYHSSIEQIENQCRLTTEILDNLQDIAGYSNQQVPRYSLTAYLEYLKNLLNELVIQRNLIEIQLDENKNNPEVVLFLQNQRKENRARIKLINGSFLKIRSEIDRLRLKINGINIEGLFQELRDRDPFDEPKKREALYRKLMACKIAMEQIDIDSNEIKRELTDYHNRDIYAEVVEFVANSVANLEEVLENLKEWKKNVKSINEDELKKNYIEFTNKIKKFIDENTHEADVLAKDGIKEIKRLMEPLSEIYKEILDNLTIKEEEEWKSEFREEETRKYKMPPDVNPDCDVFRVDVVNDLFRDDVVNTKVALKIYSQSMRMLYAKQEKVIDEIKQAESLEQIFSPMMREFDVLDEDNYKKIKQAIAIWDPYQNNETYNVNSNNERKNKWMTNYNNMVIAGKCGLMQSILTYCLIKAKAEQLIDQARLQPMAQYGNTAENEKLAAELTKKKFLKRIVRHIAEDQDSIHVYSESHLYNDILAYYKGKYDKMCRAADAQVNELIDNYINLTKAEKEPILQKIRQGIKLSKSESKVVPELLTKQINALAREYAQLQIFAGNKDLTFYRARILAAHHSLSKQNTTFKGKNYTDLELIKKNPSRITTVFVNVYYLISSVFVPLAIYRALDSKKTRGHHKFWKRPSYDVKKSAQKVEKLLPKQPGS